MSKVDYSHNSYERPKLKTPNGEKKLLLHSCCAPCAGEIMEALAASEIDTTIYFYNPNIHPFDEYELRKEENIRFAEKLGMPIIDADYDRDEWFYHVDRILNRVHRAKGEEKWRLTNIMLDATTEPIIDYNTILFGLPLLSQTHSGEVPPSPRPDGTNPTTHGFPP